MLSNFEERARVLGIEYTPPEVPAEIAYENYGTTVTGWTTSFSANGSGATSASVSLYSGGSTPNSLYLRTYGGTVPVSPLPSATASRTISGLTVGLSYTLTGVISQTSANSARCRLRIGSDSTAWVTGNPVTSVSVTFTASATSLTLYMEVEDNPVNAGASAGVAMTADNIVLTRDAYTPTLPDYPLSVIDGSITLDQSWNPYVQCSLRAYTPDVEAELDAIDPRDNLRVLVELERDGAIREFDLVLVSRKVDHETGTMDLVLESDESALVNYGLVSATSERTYGLSVKDAVEYALDKIGATLEPGATDFELDNSGPVIQATNLLVNPSAEVDATNWVIGTGTSAVARSTTVGGFVGSAAIRATASALTMRFFAAASVTAPVAVTVGTEYTFSVYIRSQIARTATVELIWRTAANATISTTASASVATTTTGWTRLSVTGTAPATAVGVLPTIQTTPNTAGNFHYLDGAMLTEGATVLDYFDGDTAASGIDYYEWSGTANASTSTHKKQGNNATVWEPGVKAWDYITPLVEAGNLRLYCDESRRWFLEPSGTLRDGLLTIAESYNLTRATDRIDLSETSDYVTGVVVRYQDLDAEGKPRTTYDVAGTGEVARNVVTYERAYPGPGAAQAILDRAQGRGRVYELSAISQYTATPGQSVSATLPGVEVHTGVLAAVTWSFPDAEMDIRSRGLIETPESAWLFDDVGATWASLASGIDWSEDL